MTNTLSRRTLVLALLLMAAAPLARARKAATWKQASDADLASLLPARAPVEKEHIETEMRTASGIVSSNGHFIAGVVLITAGYSADGKYSHYLLIQSPVTIGGIAFRPGEYVFGYEHQGEVLRVHFHEAATGKLVGTAEAHLIPGSGHITSLHIWPPAEKAIIQIGRFELPYELGEDQ
jgi:hypothetical protein